MTIGHNSKIGLNELPASMKEIAELFGLGMVYALVEHFGGVELKIPAKLKPDHMLLVLGEQNAEILCRYYPGDTILVPLTLDKKKRWRQVTDLRSRGKKSWEIARELNISQRHVRRLANAPETEVDPRQTDFFANMDDD